MHRIQRRASALRDALREVTLTNLIAKGEFETRLGMSHAQARDMLATLTNVVTDMCSLHEREGG